VKKVVLCPNITRDIDLKVTNSVARMLQDNGIDYEICTLSNIDVIKNTSKTADALITFGGDGTILHAARAVSELSVPLLGVNLGHKGFIAELEPGDIDLINKLIKGEYTIEKRMMIGISIVRKGKTIHTDRALNDIVIGGMARIIGITVYGDSRKISSFSGDGIVVATPTGSTAYSMAAGGPIVEPEAENIIVTPICPHVLGAKPYVLASNRQVEVELGNVEGKVAYASIDGEKPIHLRSGDKILVTKSQIVTELIKLNDRSFYEKVSKKLGDST
jgi:NAD+ kinase